MCMFIANQIKKQAKKSTELGREKYMAYFIKTRIYEDWRSGVDAILVAEGYEDCIVAE